MYILFSAKNAFFSRFRNKVKPGNEAPLVNLFPLQSEFDEKDKENHCSVVINEPLNNEEYDSWVNCHSCHKCKQTFQFYF